MEGTLRRKGRLLSLAWALRIADSVAKCGEGINEDGCALWEFGERIDWVTKKVQGAGDCVRR